MYHCTPLAVFGLYCCYIGGCRKIFWTHLWSSAFRVSRVSRLWSASFSHLWNYQEEGRRQELINREICSLESWWKYCTDPIQLPEALNKTKNLAEIEKVKQRENMRSEEAGAELLPQVLTNKKQRFSSRPIRSQYSSHVICVDQSEDSVWLTLPLEGIKRDPPHFPLVPSL